MMHARIPLNVWSVLYPPSVLLVLLLLGPTLAFKTPSFATLGRVSSVVPVAPVFYHQRYLYSCQHNDLAIGLPVVRLSATSGGGGGDEMTPTERILENEKLDPTTRAVVEAATKKRLEEQTTGSGSSEEKPYPIDLPSPVLLATSMVLAIVSTGSLFELVGGSSATLPFAATAAIAAIGTPTAIFLLLAAIAKATAETEEDDKKFLSGK